MNINLAFYAFVHLYILCCSSYTAGYLNFLAYMIIYYCWMWSLARLWLTLSATQRYFLACFLISILSWFNTLIVFVLISEWRSHWPRLEFVFGACIWVSFSWIKEYLATSSFVIRTSHPNKLIFLATATWPESYFWSWTQWNLLLPIIR